MKQINDLIDKERISQEIRNLQTNIRLLKEVLDNKLEYVRLEITYHNRDEYFGTYFPEDDYYLSIVVDYCDDYRRKLIAADEILKEESHEGDYYSFKVKNGGVIVSPPTVSRKEFREITESEDERDIRQLIKEIYKISRRLKSANDTIDKSSRMLDLQKKFKVEFQDKEKIEELKKGLAKITKLKNELIAQLQIRKEELKQKFGIDIEELQRRIQRTR